MRERGNRDAIADGGVAQHTIRPDAHLRADFDIPLEDAANVDLDVPADPKRSAHLDALRVAQGHPL